MDKLTLFHISSVIIGKWRLGGGSGTGSSDGGIMSHVGPACAVPTYSEYSLWACLPSG
jgi:hypothetical protein